MAVELVGAEHQSWPDMLTASGNVTAWQEASIGTEVAGIRLEEVLADVGTVVHKDQLLARYSEDTLKADLAQLDARVAEAQANLAKAKADVVRADRMEASAALPKQVIENYRTQAQIAEAQLASAKALRDAQALKLRHARVVAPDDGVISARSATVGAVGTLGAELFRLVRQNRLEWRAEVPGEALAKLKPGGQAVIQRLDGGTVTGTIRQLAPTVDMRTRNGLVYVDLPPNSGLAAGMYLTGRFTLASRDALVLPESAIVLRDGNDYVMLIDAQHRVQEVKVETGRRQNGGVEILGSNIDPAQRFVKSGGAFVGDGDLVTVAPSGAAGAS